MPSDPIVLDSVRFFDRSTERYIPAEEKGKIMDLNIIPSKGDFVRVDGSEIEYVVLDRHFTFQGGVCTVKVDVQPADNFRPLT